MLTTGYRRGVTTEEGTEFIRDVITLSAKRAVEAGGHLSRIK
jgi:hypothetical protein